MNELCVSCANSIFCETWGEWKCRDLEIRIRGSLVECGSYKKRPRDFKESKCQCEDCLNNAALYED